MAIGGSIAEPGSQINKKFPIPNTLPGSALRRYRDRLRRNDSETVARYKDVKSLWVVFSSEDVEQKRHERAHPKSFEVRAKRQSR